MHKSKIAVILFFLFGLLLQSKIVYAQTELIQNGGFESGPQFEAPPWVFEGFDKTTRKSSTPIVIADPLFANSGKRGLAIGTNNAIQLASQQITIPSGASKVTLSLFLEITSVEPVNSVTDIMAIRLTQTDKTTEVKNLETFANTDENEFRNFKKVSYDLTAFSGRTLVIQFFCGNDASFNTIFNVDDVSILATGGSTGDFSLSITPTTRTVKPGETADYSLIRTGTLNGSVTISFSGLPPNSTVPAFSSPSPTPFKIVTSSNTPTGTYTFTATGTGGGLTRTATATIVVGSSQSFKLNISPTSQTIEAGKSTSFNLSAQGTNGFNQPIELQAGVVDNDTTIRVSLPSSTILPGNTATVTVTTSVNTKPGDFQLFITGVVPQLQLADILDFNLTVTPPAGPNITSVIFDGKKQLTIVGTKFTTSPKIFINNLDKTSLLKTVTDTVLIAKGKSTKLGLTPGNNTVQLIDSTGTLSNTFTFSNLNKVEYINIFNGETIEKDNSSVTNPEASTIRNEKKNQLKNNSQELKEELKEKN